MADRSYIAIDLKSFYASVECVDRGLDPLTTNLVVADESRTEKTICLAVSPSLKAFGISGRARLFEVVQRVGEVNAERLLHAGKGGFSGRSHDASALAGNPKLEADYIVAPPRMARYMAVSAQVYGIYLDYIAPEDIHVYSVDEVFMDVTHYLRTYRMSPRELAATIVQDVLRRTGITATAGIGTNLYLCKVAMDILAKHADPGPEGVRLAELDEMSYRRELWAHTPLTDFWRVGPGYARKLERNGLYTMGDIARCSLGGPGDFHNEALLYSLFGVNAELLIDHAWGWEPCTIADIRAYTPQTTSLSSGQVLQCPYPEEKARLIVREMADQVAMALVARGMVTDQIVLTLGYDVENLSDPRRRERYRGEVTTDHYGRQIPKHGHGVQNLGRRTNSARLLTQAAMGIFDRVANPELLVRRVNLGANRLLPEKETVQAESFQQLDLFADPRAQEQQEAALARERKMQEAMLSIRRRFGKNAILRGMDLEDGATTQARNGQIGGHRAT